ncbi:MAG: SH3 domain-containing protein [Candidatus Aminicenantes bacterium]|nr:SH3 domain-containing protein [Candidatus Aminicenantes bacterium]
MNKKNNRTQIILISLLLLFPSLFFPQEAKIKLKVVADLANIRVQPAIDSPIIRQIEKNEILEALDQQGDWFRVIFLKDSGEATTGYVHESLVTVTERAPEKVLQKVIKPIEEETPKKKTTPPPKETPVKPSVKKPEIQTPQPEQTTPEDSTIKRFGFKFSVGSNYVVGGQLNEGAAGLADYYRETLGIKGTYKVRPLHLSYLASTEAFIPINSIFSIGIGLDYYRGELESVVKFNRADFSDFYSAKPRVDALPISVFIAVNPVPFISLKIGVEYTFAKAFYYYRYQTDDFWQEWSGSAKAQGIGFLAGVGYEYEISSFAKLFVEAVGHFTKIEGFKGTDNYRESTSYTYSESGPLYFYNYQLNPYKTVPLLYIRERKPAEAWVVDAQEALINFSGVALKAGIKFWF